jgi:8-oxo-dGTP diphosphatase
MKVVAAVIRSPEGLILITQRGKGMSFEGKWEFPGGKIENGEDHKDALKREIKEELTLDINVGDRALEWKYEYPFGIVDFIAFDSAVSKGELTLVEHMDAKWVRASDLKAYDWVPADNSLVDHLTGMY